MKFLISSELINDLSIEDQKILSSSKLVYTANIMEFEISQNEFLYMKLKYKDLIQGGKDKCYCLERVSDIALIDDILESRKLK